MSDWARESVDKIASHGGRCDFAAQVAVPFTLRIIAKILGIAESDEPELNRLCAASSDLTIRFGNFPSRPRTLFMKHCAVAGITLTHLRPTGILRRNRMSRAQSPTPLSMTPRSPNSNASPTMSCWRLPVTTPLRSRCRGGLHALIKHPDQLARLQRDPSMLDGAIEEILRWTAPSRHFMRTAKKDTELGGQPIRAGEAVAIFFPSANHDEEVFADADSFSIERAPNPHVTFGRGAHSCLGQTLARMEMRALLGELLRRLRKVEICCSTRRAHSLFLTGFTSLPLQFELA